MLKHSAEHTQLHGLPGQTLLSQSVLEKLAKPFLAVPLLGFYLLKQEKRVLK